MAPRRVKKSVKRSAIEVNDADAKEATIDAFREVQHQSAAIRAIRYVEIERLLTELRLLRSYLNEEQLRTPLLQFFEKNLPNLSLRKENQAPTEVHWKVDQSSLNHAPGSNLHASLLHQMSIAYPKFSAAVPSFGGFELSSKAVKTNLLGVNDLQMGDSVLEELSHTQMLGFQDGLQTPGVSSQRMSFGMTPKTVRLPKKGEMILSVHGSPLGVFKEDNLEAINE